MYFHIKKIIQMLSSSVSWKPVRFSVCASRIGPDVKVASDCDAVCELDLGRETTHLLNHMKLMAFEYI